MLMRDERCESRQQLVRSQGASGGGVTVEHPKKGLPCEDRHRLAGERVRPSRIGSGTWKIEYSCAKNTDFR